MMGRRGAKKFSNACSPISLRVGGFGKVQSKGRGANVKSMLKYEHLKNLVVWFTGGDVPIPSLAVFFGRRLAADREASAIDLDPQLLSCQRCETVLRPGFNCTVRIEKNPGRKHSRRKKSNAPLTQNNVIYSCHFCSFWNSKRGTVKGHMKEICPVKQRKSPPRPKTVKDLPRNKCVDEEKDTRNVPSLPERANDNPMENADVNTPRPMLTLERSKRKRKARTRKSVEPDSSSAMTGLDKTVGGTSMRKRKSWKSLKEIAERDMSFNAVSLKIPFLL